MALAASSGGGPNSVSKETPISNYPSLTYGLQETHTTILPWTGWLSAARLDKDTPVVLELRMNTPYDMVITGTTSADPVGITVPTKGLAIRPLDAAGRNNPYQKYPLAFTASTTTATERPQWRDFWANLYDYYTVLGCEYKIIVTNPVTSIRTFQYDTTLSPFSTPAVQAPIKDQADVVCGVEFDTYSDTATSTGNVMPRTEYEEVRNFKDIRWYKIPDSNGTTVISGTYKPGQAKRNITNDGDVKTWTATGSTLPNLKENMLLCFWQDPLNNCGDGRAADQFGCGVNIEINLKYIVQFKDLKQQARYPNTLITDQDIQLNLNEVKTNTGNPMMRSIQ